MPEIRWKEEQMKDKVFLRQWKYYLLHNDRYMSLYLCPNPQNVQHQDWSQLYLWVILKGPCTFILGKKWTILVRMLIMGEAMHVWGQQYISFKCLNMNIWICLNMKLLSNINSQRLPDIGEKPLTKEKTGDKAENRKCK